MCERIQHDSDCAVHNEPVYPAGPCGCGALVTAALEHALRALVSTNNCLTTDRPDLPRAPDTGWTTDFSKEIELLNAALAAMEFGSRSDARCEIPRTNPSDEKP